MIERLKDFCNTAKDTIKCGLEKARSAGILRKSLMGVAGVIAIAVILIVFFKAMGLLLDSVYNFIERHFFRNCCFLCRRRLPILPPQREESGTSTGATGKDKSK